MSRDFDLIVIGAGINGAAIAREAVLHGFSVLVLDQGDLGAGTSSASSRLIHGGLRYLEHGEIGLVHESLGERERLLANAPHLVAPLELFIPIYRHGRRPVWQIHAGMWLYDLLSAGKSLPRHAMLSREALLARLPGLSRDRLVAGACYFDAQIAFPERLVLENLQDAVRHGAELRTYTRATRIRVEEGRAVGVEWCGRDRGGYAAARAVVNAAGPWLDTVLGPLQHEPLIGGTKGSHLIVAPFPNAPGGGVYLEARADGRPLFILPWNGLYLIGTTDLRFEGDPADARIDETELGYLAAETESAFPAASRLRARVLYTHTGVRPLPHRPHGDEGSITRRHLIRAHRAARGLYSVVGGKLTTHRALAEDVMRRVSPRVRAPSPRLRAPRASATRNRPLPGALGAADRDALLGQIGALFGAPEAQRLWRIYGSAAAAVAERARDGDLADVIDPATGTRVAELVHAIESEWAATLTDILQRRCMTGLGADFGLAAAPRAAEWLRRLGFWDGPRAEQELADYRAYAKRHDARALSRE